MGPSRRYVSQYVAVFFICMGWTVTGMTQTVPALPPPQATELNDSLRELKEQIRELQSAVIEIRSEAAQYRSDAIELRRELDATRAQLQVQARDTEKKASLEGKPREPDSSNSGYAGGNSRRSDHITKLEEDIQLLSGKVNEQYQTKVESASKYRVRLSGIVLFNLFTNHGRVDNLDIPSLAYPVPEGTSGNSFGGTLRQSELGLEVFGPDLAGARTSADVEFDFAGGFTNTVNGVNTGIVRLRTGTVRLDWARTSIVAGQDGLFFSPLTPTSFASLATPAFSYAGNLWGWTPQVRVEHRFLQSENSRLVLQGGIFDSLSGELPQPGYHRQQQAGEASGQPAYASRIAWTGTVFGQPLTVGTGGYYGRQNYGFGRKVDGWAATADWTLPLGPRFSLAGEFYRGRAIGGLGGGIGRSVLFSGAPANASSAIQPLDSLGGWTQLKFRPAVKVELNAAFGQDNSYAQDLRTFPHGYAYLDPSLVRNQAWMANLIFRPRSDLLLSAEYHYLKTFVITNDRYSADHVNLTMGVLF